MVDRRHIDDAVASVNASILKFLLIRIEGIEATSAAPFIKLLQWDKVLDVVGTSYGSIQSPNACNDLTSELQQITLGDDETHPPYKESRCQHSDHLRIAGGQESSNDFLRSLRRKHLYKRSGNYSIPTISNTLVILDSSIS
jgi:hypothetical protein